MNDNEGLTSGSARTQTGVPSPHKQLLLFAKQLNSPSSLFPQKFPCSLCLAENFARDTDTDLESGWWNRRKPLRIKSP